MNTQPAIHTSSSNQSNEKKRWFFWLLSAFSLEALVFCMMFYYQNVEYIGKPVQQEWLTIYGARTLEEFIWRRYIIFELLRRLPWSVYGVGIVWLAERFPILQTQVGNGVFWRNVWYQLIIAVAVACLHGLVVQNTLTVLFKMENFPYYVYLRNFNGIFLSFIHYIVILLIASMIGYYRQFRQEELRTAHLKTTAAQLETELAQAQLQALKMQLQPHFLFNALNSISALLYSDQRRADTMIARLGDFLRMTLESPTTQFISLKQELDLLQCYVDIETMRFPSRLQVEFRIESGLQDAEVPNLLLQPLVENSIKYGILQSTAGGKITIMARQSPSMPETLEILVRDNGPGMQHNESQNKHIYGSMRKKSGIGLQNTRERLQKLYGTEFRFDTYNAPEGGFVVYCEIPFRNKQDNTSQEHISMPQQVPSAG